MIFSFLTIILGLCVFEIICSIDNAVINAHVLKTMPDKYRKIFLFWGILFAVFVVRGLLPFIIIYIANPTMPISEILMSAFSSSGQMGDYLDESKPLLLLGGGIYLFFVFLSWLFLEEKKICFSGRKFYSSTRSLVLCTGFYCYHRSCLYVFKN